jgi:hypothetical protein
VNENLPSITVVIAARPAQAEIKAVAASRALDYLAGKLEIIVARGKQPSAQRNAALKAAKSPMDLGRSLSEFEWAIFYSPWDGDLYFNTSAVKKLQNQTAAAVSDLKLYLAANPNAKNLDELLNRLYEFDYQREQKLRELAAAASF